MKKYISVAMQLVSFKEEDVVRTSGTYEDPADQILFQDRFD